MSTADRPPNRARLVALAALAVAVGLLVMPLPDAWLGGWQTELLDFGHVPLFAALVIALRIGMGPPLYRPLLVAIGLAGVVEVVQPWVGRNGDWVDFLRGTLGALAGAAVVRAWEVRRARGQALAYLGLALVLVAGPVVEVAPYVADTAAGYRAFPVLADFSTDRELMRWECEQARFTRADGGGRLELLPGPGPYPSGALRPVAPDFRGYRWLCCEFRVPDGPLELVISVRTGTGEKHETTHAQVAETYPTGEHVVRLDLDALTARGESGPLHLADVRAVHFFTVRPSKPRMVVLSRIWLER